MIFMTVYEFVLNILLILSLLILFISTFPELTTDLLEDIGYDVCTTDIDDWLYIENILYITVVTVSAIYFAYTFIQKFCMRRYIPMPSIMYSWTKFSYTMYMMFLLSCYIYLSWSIYTLVYDLCDLDDNEREDIEYVIEKARYTGSLIMLLYGIELLTL